MPSSTTNSQLSVYLNATEIMQHGVMFLDREGNIIFVNKYFANALGYSKSGFEPKTIFQVNPHFNFIAWKELWKELTTTGQATIDTTHITSTGETIPAKLKGVLIEVDGEKYCQAIIDGEVNESKEDLYLARYCLDNVKEMIFWVNPDGSIFYANQATRNLLGYSSKELLSKKVYELEPNFTKQAWEAHWKEIKVEESIIRDTVQRTKSGEDIPVTLSTHYMNFNGREYKMVFMRDRREQKEMDKLMALSHKSLEKSIQMIYWLNADGKFVYANAITCKKFGFTKEELMQRYLWEVEPGMMPEDWQNRWRDLKTAGALELETIRKSRNGEEFPVKLHLNYLEFDGEEYNLAIVSDLRNRKKLEEIAKLSFATINQSSDMIFWLNQDGRFLYFNKVFSKLTGYSSEEVNKMVLLDFFPDNTDLEFKRGWQLLQEKKTLSSEMQITCKDGEKIWVESTVNLVKFEGVEYSSTVLRDIRERKEREKQLKEQFKKIETLRQQLQEENIILKEEIEIGQSFDHIISRSPNYKPVLRQIGQVAATDATVLILGETGTGKELIAKAIYKLSDRSEHPLITVNCGSLPENLIESELFGHEKGSFTGAFQRKTGRFEMAHKGTIFLDEIGEFPLDLQAKLLRVLQEGEFRRLGGNETIRVNVRIIAATNRKLEEEVENGKFREDLFYRLNVFPIQNIPLRERKEDIPLLVRHFVDKYNKKMGRHIEEIPQPVMKELMDYEYPGNVRELENLIERAIILSPGKQLVSNFQFNRNKSGQKKTFHGMEDMQRLHILEALRRTKGKVTGPGGAAELLKMKDKTLYSRMSKLGVRRNDFI